MPTEPVDSGIVDCFDDRAELVARIHIKPIRKRGKKDDIPLLLSLDEREAIEVGEAVLQLRENGRYNCRIEDLTGQDRSLTLSDNSLIECYGDSDSTELLIETRSSAGRLTLNVIENGNEPVVVGRGSVEIRSIKLNYREEYRGMIKSIATDARDILLQLGGATEFSLQSAWSDDSPTLIQQIEFMRSLLYGGGLWRPLERILRMPHERLEHELEIKPLAKAGKVGSALLRQLACGQPRMSLPIEHSLNGPLKGTAPRRVTMLSKRRTTDTPENRFVKHMLKDFARFLQHAVDVLSSEQIKNRNNSYSSVIEDCERMKESLNRRLQNSLFRQLEAPRTSPFGSPVLQRKAGYREVFQTWLAFKMSAHLQWEGSEDVFGGGNSKFDAGKKDLPTLYEAWLFFKLLGVFTKQFGLNYDDARDFFTRRNGALGQFTLKRGTMREIGSSNAHGMKVQAKFRYNHSFENKGENTSLESSWTRVLRPDYTISIWPEGLKPAQAEEMNAMVHIHFDAKYRVNKITEIFGDVEVNETSKTAEQKQTEEKQRETDGNYNRADLLKMHAYRDAIRRSEGAFVLYPGDTNDPTSNRRWKGFHELLPGLGAFAIRPDADGNANGIQALEDFLEDAVRQLTNRTTRLAHSRYHQRDEDQLNTKEGGINHSTVVELGNEIVESLFGSNTDTIPPAQEVIVLSGIVKNSQHLGWIETKGFYNFRSEKSKSGYLPNLAPNFPHAKLLVLRNEDGIPYPGLWKMESLEEWDNETLKSHDYPGEPSVKHYTVYKITKLDLGDTIEYDNSIFPLLMDVAIDKAKKRIKNIEIPKTSPFQLDLKKLLRAVKVTEESYGSTTAEGI